MVMQPSLWLSLLNEDFLLEALLKLVKVLQVQ